MNLRCLMLAVAATSKPNTPDARRELSSWSTHPTELGVRWHLAGQVEWRKQKFDFQSASGWFWKTIRWQRSSFLPTLMQRDVWDGRKGFSILQKQWTHFQDHRLCCITWKLGVMVLNWQTFKQGAPKTVYQLYKNHTPRPSLDTLVVQPWIQEKPSSVCPCCRTLDQLFIVLGPFKGAWFAKPVYILLWTWRRHSTIPMYTTGCMLHTPKG